MDTLMKAGPSQKANLSHKQKYSYQQINQVQNLLAKTMSTIIDYKQKNEPSSMIIFRNQEIDRYKMLLGIIDADLRQAVKVS